MWKALPAGDFQMNFSRKTIALYVGLVSVSGAVLGVFGDRLYNVTTVASKGKSKLSPGGVSAAGLSDSCKSVLL